MRIAAAALALLLASTTPAASSLDGDLSNHLREHLEGVRVGDQIATVDGEPLRAADSLFAAYLEGGWQPFWSEAGKLRPAAHRFLGLLAEAPTHGLAAGSYHEAALQRILLAPTPIGHQRLADLDLLLSDALVLLASDLAHGRVDPETLESDWVPARVDLDPVELLRSIGEGASVRSEIVRLLPAEPAYQRLRDALIRYRRLAAEDAGFELTADGLESELGRRQLEERLVLLSDLPPDPQRVVDLSEGLRSFQRRHGLAESGELDEATRRELAVPLSERVRALTLNLERWRWLPHRLGRPHLRVNIPDFRLHLERADGSELSMKVVVGRLYRRTPVFSDAIRYLVINPYWEIPHGIAVRDKLPLIREDPAYLSRQGIDVFEDWSPDATPIDAATVDWQSLDAESFSLRLRQRPGPANALGRIKFMFPNRFNVYLHDTPDRADFQLREREASSGCIRVEYALELAAALLEDGDGWDRQALVAAVESGRVRTVVLEPPVPIHLLYFTAWVDEDGAVQFRRDLYGRDARLSEALFGDAATGTG